MSSRFVSAGSFAVEAGTAQPTTAPASTPAPPLSATVKTPGAGDKETSTQKAPLLPTSTTPPTTASTAPPPQPENTINEKPKSKEWLEVEKQLEEERLQRQRDKKAAAESNEKTLFEVLQANKAAKQAAFEEANKIKNQFRALDDDEIDFLDEVVYKKRLEDERIKRETEEGLEGFRRAQGSGALGEEEDEEDEELMGVFEKGGGGRKRRRVGGGEGGLKGVKKIFGGVRRKESTDQEKVEVAAAVKVSNEPAAAKVAPTPVEAKTGGLGGLVDYGSSDED